MGTIRIVGEEAQIPESSPETKTPDNVSAPFTSELQTKAAASVLGIENPSDITKYEDKLQTLVEYAKTKTTENSLEGLKWVLRDLGERLNTPSTGETMLDYMTRYAYLELETLKLEAEKKRFKK